MWYRRTSFKSLFLIILVFCVLGITIAYALLSTTLTINGAATFDVAVWDVKIANLSASKTGDATYTLPQISDTSLTNYEIILTKPGDSVTFIFDIVNEGSVDAYLSALTKNTPTCNGVTGSSTGTTDAPLVCNNLTYTLTYENGNVVSTDDTLTAYTTKKVNLTLSYNSYAQQVPTNDVAISNLDITMIYSQA